MKGQLRYHIQGYMEEYKYLANDLHGHLEIGNQEFHSMHVLCKMPRKEGPEVTEEYVVSTGFLGVWNSGKSGLVVTYMCEYDALSEVRHGHGHNLIAGISLAAGCTLESILSNIGGEVRIIDTSAEENFGGRVPMVAAHVFDDVDAVPMLYPGMKNSPRGRALVVYPLRFEFFGQNAHACTPQNGKSALDAIVISHTLINLLCQFARPDAFIHGVIAHRGEATNVIPAYAGLEYYFHGETMGYAKEFCEEAKACIEGACTMSECTSRITTYECPYDGYVISYILADIPEDEYKDFSYTWEGVDEAAWGSSSVGSVSYCYPTLQGYTKIANSCIDGYSCEMTAATISQQGSRALFDGAFALVDIGRHLIMEPDTMEKVWKELKASRK